jgi:hypothetical protein
MLLALGAQAEAGMGGIKRTPRRDGAQGLKGFLGLEEAASCANADCRASLGRPPCPHRFAYLALQVRPAEPRVQRKVGPNPTVPLDLIPAPKETDALIGVRNERFPTQNVHRCMHSKHLGLFEHKKSAREIGHSYGSCV